jgi:hypothetical protein
MNIQKHAAIAFVRSVSSLVCYSAQGTADSHVSRNKRLMKTIALSRTWATIPSKREAGG